MRSTKKSLALSIMSLMLCVAMLLGTTFAWFTDSVTSGKNKIEAGNLDIELEYFDGSSWAPVTESVKLFDDNALWEPGYTEVAYLRMSNKGSLDLKYNLAINIANEVAGTNKDDESFKLSDYIKMGVDESWAGTAEYADRATARAAVTDAGNITTYTKSGSILASETEPMNFAIVVFMPEEVGNVANHKTGTTPPSIELGVSVTATQLASESDSFDNQYDIGTPWLGAVDATGLAANTDTDKKTVKISSAEQLAAFAQACKTTSYAGYTVSLEKDIDLNNIAWTPINYSKNDGMIFDGANHTIVNMNVSGKSGVGLFGDVTGATIKNVNIDTAVIKGVKQMGAVVGVIYGNIENCKVENVTLTATGEWDAANSEYVDGAKVGGIVGRINENDFHLTNCSAKNVTINGYRDLGGIAGCTYDANTLTGNTITNVVINQGDYSNYEDGDYTTMGAIYGRCITGYGAGEFQANTGDVTINKCYVVKVADNATTAEIQTAINSAVSTADTGDTVVLPTSNQPIPVSSIGKSITIKGDGETKLDASTAGTGVSASGVVFEDVVFYSGNATYNTIRGTVTYKNCSFDGLVNSYDDSTYIGCTFTNSVSGKYLAHVYGGKAVYTDCTFNGSNRCVYVYTEGGSADVTFTGCTFNITDSTGKAAVMVNCNENNGVSTVAINNCTANGGNNSGVVEESTETCEYHGLWGVKKIAGANTLRATVTVDGATVYKYPTT